MNKTEQYQLNQWELTDQIKMEDFNADNAKIDAQLARLRANVADLAFQVGQLSIAAIEHHGKAVSRRFVIYDGFNVGSSFTLSDGLIIRNKSVTFEDSATSGTVTATLSPDLPGPWKEIYLWLHSQGGTVTPKLNGTPMTHFYTNDFDIAGKGDFSTLYGYRWSGPRTATQTLTFELSRPTGTANLAFTDYCVAYL